MTRLVLLALLALAGCDLVRGPAPAAAPAAEDPAVLRLVEAAARAENALRALAAEHGAGDAAPPRVVPPELLEKVAVDWIGPLETLARDLAGRAGYRFVAAGRPPVVPLVVSVRAESAPIVLLLRDAGLQAGDAARLTVDAGAREVRIEWTPGEGI